MKIAELVKSKDEANFVNIDTAEVKNKAQVYGELRGGILCMMAKKMSTGEINERLERMLKNVEPASQELHQKVEEFLTNLGKPTKEELAKQAKAEKQAAEQAQKDLRKAQEEAEVKEKADEKAEKKKEADAKASESSSQTQTDDNPNTKKEEGLKSTSN